MQHILVVDDDSGICDLLKHALEGESRYRVTCARRGLDALWYFENDRPGIAIIDVMLPDMSGIRLAKRAIEHGVVPLIITGHHGSVEWLDSLGCPYLAKPFRIADLLARVLGLVVDRDGHDKAARMALGQVPERRAATGADCTVACV
jgi:DNA-binding response OmpR family regulator